MPYILRFTQRYRPESRQQFLALEEKFAALEKSAPHLPQGRRSQPLAGSDANHTLIWECEFPTFAGIENALTQLANNPTHTALFQQQSPYITDIRTDIFEVLF